MKINCWFIDWLHITHFSNVFSQHSMSDLSDTSSRTVGGSLPVRRMLTICRRRLINTGVPTCTPAHLSTGFIIQVVKLMSWDHIGLDKNLVSALVLVWRVSFWSQSRFWVQTFGPDLAVTNNSGSTSVPGPEFWSRCYSRVAVQSLSSVFVLRVTVCGYLISIINTGVPTCIPTHLPMDGSGCRRRCHFTASNSPTTSCTVADTLESHGLFSLLFVWTKRLHVVNRLNERGRLVV